MRRAILLTLCLWLLGSVLAAQLKVDVALINVVATVTDSKGRYISDLTAEDFILEEDGTVQTIAHFTHSSNLPVSVGIVLDTSGSMERKIGTASTAVERFIRTIHEDDDIFLMTFDNQPNVIQDFTNNRQRLAAALRRIRLGGGTALYDAVDEGLEKIRRGTHTKKAMLLISDGEDTQSGIDFDKALLSVRESEYLVYCLGISPGSSGPMKRQIPLPGTPPIIIGPGSTGIPFPLPGGGGGRTGRGSQQRPDTVDMGVLNAFADASGGRAWLLSGTWSDNRGNQIEAALDEIAAELRNQYSIGYYPSHGMDDGKWHRVEIRTKNQNYRVRARKDYFGGESERK